MRGIIGSSSDVAHAEGFDLIERVVEDLRSGGFEEVGRGLNLSRLHLEQLHLDHVGVAVRSLAQVSRSLEMLGLRTTKPETVEAHSVRVAMIPVGESRIELLEGIGDQSTVARFVARRGEGVHHLAFRANGLEGLFRRLTDEGIRLASPAVGPGFGGHACFFIHPSETNGALVELVEDKS